ncbi:SseB family protein [Tersicoccus sp. MR15.9]|uniref:SseB family protein n=1 Tax=Tersicoccus mangrovi TaxID=3121635 RepID=UPI002FE5B0C9
MSRELPGHIRALLDAAGGPADSAGVPWAGRDLAGSVPATAEHAGDDGLADARVAAALDALRAGRAGEAAVVDALRDARIFVPLIASVAGDANDPVPVSDKEADLSLVTIAAPDGRTALPVFTSVDALRAWHPDARPIPTWAPRAALSAAAEDAQLMVLDPGGAVSFVVRRPALWALAQQKPWTPSYADPAVAAAARGVTVSEPAVLQVDCAAGRGVVSADRNGARIAGGGPGPELRIGLTLRSGLDRHELDAVVRRIQERLAADPVFADGVDSIEMRIVAAPA